MVRQFALSLSISDKSANALNEFGLSPIHNSGVECNVPSCECPNRRFFGQVDGISKHWPRMRINLELVSPSVILYENWTMQKHRDFVTCTYSRRFVNYFACPAHFTVG